MNLSALLTGTALDVYSRMSVPESDNYGVLKTNLFKRFNMTEEGFRTRFSGYKIEKGETPTQYLVRLENYLSQAGAELNFKGLKDLVLREEFLNSSKKKTITAILERKGI
jgi:hypothetical protein